MTRKNPAHRLGWAALLLMAASTTAWADDNLASRVARIYDDIRTETLPNGLRVYLKPIPGSPVVSVMVAYKVGSSDEDLTSTGLAHYLEHLMFKGTDKLFPGDIDRLTLRNGGANNAYTTEDMTVYHFDFAADRWEPALDVEADRMRNLRIDARHEFEREKTVVVGELQANEDSPWDLEQKAILPLLFNKGPYGHPVIGEREHVFAATAPIIKGFYDRWYYPNNAALVICGGFDPDRAVARVRQLFSSIPAGNLPERKQATPVTRNGPVRKELPSKFEVPRMVMGFNAVRSGDPDSYALDVVDGILSGGKTGRLYKKLVEEERLASEVSSSNSPGRYPGWFSVQAELILGKDRARAEELVLAELKRLQQEPVPADELQRVQRNVLARAVFGRESVHALADSIARGVTTNDLDYLKNYLPRVQAVTARQVQETARKYFDPEKRVVVWSVPRGVAPGGKDKDSAGRLGTPRSSARARDGFRQGQAGGAGEVSLKDAKRVELPNGLTLLLYENHRLPVVVAEAYVRHVRLLEPDDKAGVATLVGGLLDEGTTKHSGPQIAELLENAGSILRFNSNGGSLKMLSSERAQGLELFFECLMHANFPKDVFDREKDRLLSLIEEANRQADSRAQMAYRAAVYGKHPYARPILGRRETVQTLTPEDCRAFHARLFVPSNTVVALVGDFDSAQVVEEIKRLTEAWKKSSAPKPAPCPALEKPAGFTEKFVSMPEAEQLHFYLGHPGIRRNNPDYFKLLVMDYVLGTGPGFTDRLSARLRDREGLGYTVSASITGSAGEEPGLFTCYIGTYPQFLQQAKKGFLEEIHRLRTEPPTAEEVEDAKRYLLGNLPFHFVTNENIAQQLLTVEQYHLGLDYLDKYRKAVAAVTPADVQAMASKYLDPQHMVLITVGAVDEQGKPLEKAPPPKKL
jgi:zinc protease